MQPGAISGSVSISNIDYNAESHPPDRTRTDLVTVVRAGRTQTCLCAGTPVGRRVLLFVDTEKETENRT